MFSRFLFILLALLYLPLSSFSLTLMNKLEQSREGDFIVTLMNKTYSLVSIYSKNENSIIFEQISVPHGSMQRNPDWKAFVKKSAPNATSWILYEIDLKTGKILECYSVLSGTFLDLSSAGSILSKMFQLDLISIGNDQRRRIGASSSLSGFDTRKLWNPPLVFNRKRDKKAEFAVYHATWPQDKTILAGKTVELYFDSNRPQFPFPFWMQIKDASDASFKLPTVDAGEGLSSSVPEMPRRLPYFYDKVSMSSDQVVVRLSIPKYYQGLKLHFISYMPKIGDPIHADFEPISGEGDECIEFHIPQGFIKKHLDYDRPYHMMLTADSHPNMRVESAKSVRFKTRH